jgi:hypothetical protein
LTLAKKKAYTHKVMGLNFEHQNTEDSEMQRRDFLRQSLIAGLGIAAGNHFIPKPDASKENVNSKNSLAPFFRSGTDANGVIRYEHPLGKQSVSIMYTHHNEVVDPTKIPEDVTDLSYDTGGTNFQAGHGRIFAKDAPEHYKELGRHIIDKYINLHLMCPASPFSDNEDTTVPQGVDYIIAASSSGIGALLIKDAYCDLPKDIAAIPQSQAISKDTLVAWNILKGGVGASLVEPVAAALARVPDMGTLDRVTETWLQSVFSRNPQFLALMDRFIDLLHVIKVRQLMADRERLDPIKSQHFQLVLGKTHVGVASGLEKPIEELLNELDHPIIRAMLHSMLVPNLRTISVSERSDFTGGMERVYKTFFPDIFDRLTETQQDELLRLYLAGNSSIQIVGATQEQASDITSYLAGR